jgi:hypothetical protein
MTAIGREAERMYLGRFQTVRFLAKIIKSCRSAHDPFSAINRFTPAREHTAAIRELAGSDERQQSQRKPP